jgi:chromosomal replication initiator protein
MCLCARISERLAEEVGADRYERFFGSASRLALCGDRLDVDVPNRFVADWIKRHFTAAIHDAASRETGAPVQVCIRVRGADAEARQAGDDPADATGARGEASAAPPPARPDAGASPPRAEPGRAEARHPAPAAPRHHPQHAGRRSSDAPASRGRRREPRHTLDSFFVGEANRLAYEAAVRVAESSRSDFQVLFLHGPCGVGKTHLARGLVRRRRQRFPQQNLRYVTGEQFTNEFIAALKSGKLEAFRAQLRRVDLLCIDDVHFLSNKQATQAELLHTLKMLDLTGGQLVLASDEHPSQIRKFAEHLTSRFLSGLVAQIDPPDLALRKRLALEFASRRRLLLSDPVADALAHRFAGSPRELHGAIMKLEVVQQLCGGVDGAGVEGAGAVGMAVYRRAFPQAPSKPSRPVQAAAVLECVCEHLQVELSEMLGRSRHRRVVLARSLCAYLLRELTTLSFPEIAERMSRPNHSTIITACQRLRGQLERDERVSSGPGLPEVSLRALVEELKRRVLRA